MRTLLAISLLLVACDPAPSGGGDEEETTSGGEGETVVTVEQVDPDSVDEGPITCISSDDCPEGQRCSTPEGCNVPRSCEPLRPCTRDLVQYCGCDGQTMEGSGSCPPAPYAHRGPCES
ncbi:MAG: hypothetical protein AAGE52_22785 [Myxococcota bacterium]